MTETFMTSAIRTWASVGRATVGFPLPGCRRAAVDAEETPVADGERRDCSSAVRTLFAGYWRRPDATAAAFIDGYFRTGDHRHPLAGRLLHTPGRKSDLIISGGFNIYPREIEELPPRAVGSARRRRSSALPDDRAAARCRSRTSSRRLRCRACWRPSAASSLAPFKVPRRVHSGRHDPADGAREGAEALVAEAVSPSSVVRGPWSVVRGSMFEVRRSCVAGYGSCRVAFGAFGACGANRFAEVIVLAYQRAGPLGICQFLAPPGSSARRTLHQRSTRSAATRRPTVGGSAGSGTSSHAACPPLAHPGRQHHRWHAGLHHRVVVRADEHGLLGHRIRRQRHTARCAGGAGTPGRASSGWPRRRRRP